MAWNPETYNKFKSDRFLPFYDCLKLIDAREHMDVIDLGCGTGELTRKLADALPNPTVLGIDASEEMLTDSKPFASDNVKFEHKSIQDQLNQDTKFDLIFSNAAIQWVDDHETLFPKLISRIKANGQLVVQMPAQHHNVSNKMLDALADEEAFKSLLNHWKRISPVLETDRYAQILFENGCKKMTVFEKIYPLVLQDANALFDWVSGTAMIPYVEKLGGENREKFEERYRQLLRDRFDKSPVFYPFKRIIIEGRF